MLGWNVVRLQESIYDLAYKFYGLRHKEIKIDEETSIACWIPKHPGKSYKNPAGESVVKHPLLLLHGFGASAVWQWDKQLPDFSRYFDIYMPDLIFFGGSVSTSSSRSEVFQAECMIKLMDKLGVERFHVNGISYGGFVAYRMATTYPARVQKLILSSSGIGMTAEEYNQMLERWQVSDIAELLLPSKPHEVQKLMDVAYHKAFQAPRWVLKQTLEALFQDMREEKKQLLNEITRYFENPLDELPIPSMETLIVFGEHDEIFVVAIAKRLDKLFGKQSKLVVLENASHMSNGQRFKQYNKATVDFLTSIQSSSS